MYKLQLEAFNEWGFEKSNEVENKWNFKRKTICIPFPESVNKSYAHSLDRKPCSTTLCAWVSSKMWYRLFSIGTTLPYEMYKYIIITTNCSETRTKIQKKDTYVYFISSKAHAKTCVGLLAHFAWNGHRAMNCNTESVLITTRHPPLTLAMHLNTRTATIDTLSGNAHDLNWRIARNRKKTETSCLYHGYSVQIAQLKRATFIIK